MWRPKRASSGQKRRRIVAAQRKRAGLTKRRKFLLVAVILTLLLFVVQSLPPSLRLVAFLIYFVVSYGMSAWALFQDLNGVEWFTNLILPSLFPVSVGLFYFLLPQQAITRLVVMGMFVVGMYALLLTANIFGVAASRTIQLLRAARAVGFLFTVVTSAFLFHLILSFKVNFLVMGIGVSVISFLLFVQGLWSSTLEEKLSKRIMVVSGVSALMIGELAMVIAFWPIDVAMGSIFLSMVMYVLLGIEQHMMEERLFKKTIQEYLGFGVIVFVIVASSVILRWIS